MANLVSVIIPIHNMEAYLEETLASVAASDYPDFEVVMVDDGSTDGSVAIAEAFCQKDKRFSLFVQANAGVCRARNHAIEKSKGLYILPVDSDNKISSDYISRAAEALDADPDVKLVTCEAVKFGGKNGPWKLKAYSPRLLARKNMIDNCSMYRRSDWQRKGGYKEDIVAFEDWEFWLSLMEDGGKVVRLPIVGLYYRVREGSFRSTYQARKRRLIDQVNVWHKPFFYKQLGGKLHHRRSWSRFLNFFHRIACSERFVLNPAFPQAEHFLYALPDAFDAEGEVLQNRRNCLKTMQAGPYQVVVKSFQTPHLFNRIAYGFLRGSKAARSYRYALKLQALEVGTPAPVGYYECRRWGLFSESYFVSLKSVCPYTFNDLIRETDFPERHEILIDMARFTARLHENGILPLDYSAGNLLFERRNGDTLIELIDLNRMRFTHVDQKKGCRNFERLDIDREALAWMAEAYAQARGFDVETCQSDVLSMRWYKHNGN